jgi:hypothetical protein
MSHRILGLLAVVAAAVAVNWCILRFWWRAIITNNRWILLFPIALPLMLFGPMYVVGSAEAWALPNETGWQRFSFAMLWLLPTFFISFLYARKYHHSRSTSAHKPHVTQIV